MILEPPAIQDYGIIGDCRTAALVSRDGSIDWLCLPRFDGPSVFARLLDARVGGRFAITPSGAFRATRRYLEDTNLLETTFHAEGGTVRLLDGFMIVDPETRTRQLWPDHELLRRLECVGGEVEVDVVCDPRMDYARRRPRIRDLGAFGFTLDAGATSLVLRADAPLRPLANGGIGGRIRLRAGEHCHFSLTTETALPPTALPLGAAADQRIDRTTAWWRHWLEPCTYEGAYSELVRRSALTLKLLVFPPSGAIVAAPTTSLPEQIGGPRNWDYRLCWLRDASMTVRALFDLGFVHEGEAFLGWMLHATRITHPELQVVYDLYGRTEVPERSLEHLAGYRDSRPVRIGNAAARQLQLDVYGEVIAAACEFVERGGRLDDVEAAFLAGLGSTVIRRWHEPDNGMWEVRSERRHFTYSKAMCRVALDGLIRLADEGHIQLPLPRAEMLRVRDTIGECIETEGFDAELDSYVATLGGRSMDATLLLLGISGYADPSGSRMRGTLRCVRERLERNGLLLRYDYADGLPHGEGAFGLCSFWEIEMLAMQGHLDEAHRRFDHVVSFANDIGLFGEEIDAASGAALGNFPQAFTHIGLINAAAAIARAEGRAPEARAAAPETTLAESEPEEGEVVR